MRKRLNFLSTLFHESADCLSKLPALYWQPLGTFSVLLGLYAFWTVVILNLATASKFHLISCTMDFKLFKYYRLSRNKILKIINWFWGSQYDYQWFINSWCIRKEFGICKWWVRKKQFQWLLFSQYLVLAGLTAVEFEDATWVRYMWWVYIIGLIWSSEFVLACQHMIISGAVAKWYFTKCVFYIHTYVLLFY